MSTARELIPFCGTFSQRGPLDPIKPGNDRRSVCQQSWWWPTVMQNSLFLP